MTAQPGHFNMAFHSKYMKHYKQKDMCIQSPKWVIGRRILNEKLQNKFFLILI